MSANTERLRVSLVATRRREIRLLRALCAIRDYRGEPSESHAQDMEMRRIAEEAIRGAMPGFKSLPRVRGAA